MTSLNYKILVWCLILCLFGPEIISQVRHTFYSPPPPPCQIQVVPHTAQVTHTGYGLTPQSPTVTITDQSQCGVQKINEL